MGKRISQFKNTFLFVFVGLLAFNIGWAILGWLWWFIFRNDAIEYTFGFFEVLDSVFRIGLFVAIIRVILGFLSDLLFD